MRLALEMVPAGAKSMRPGQRNRTWKRYTRFGVVYVSVMTGPPVRWLPRARRAKDGAVEAGWLRLAFAVKVERRG